MDEYKKIHSGVQLPFSHQKGDLVGSSLARIGDRVIEHEVRGSGPSCIIAPVSWGIDYSLWSHYLEDLERTLMMVYFNPRGIGGSSEITSPSDCSMDSVVADMERLRKYLGFEDTTIMGHSAGGFSALQYAIRWPNWVKNLVLVATAANTDFEEAYKELSVKNEKIAEIHRKMTSPGKEEMTEGGLMRRNLGLMFSVDFKDYDPFREEFEETLSAAKVSPTHLRYHQRIDLQKYDVLDDLPMISCPTLILAGEHDLVCPPKYSEVMNEAIPDSRLVVFGDSSHWPMIEEKDKFLKSVADFIEGA
jgi:proline iminopeptidase